MLQLCRRYRERYPRQRSRRGSGAAIPPLLAAEGLAGDLGDAGNRADHAAASSGSISTFWFGALASASSAFDVVLGDEVVDRLHVARRRWRWRPSRSPWPRPRRALARLGVAERGLLAALGLEHPACFSPSALRIAACRSPRPRGLRRASRARPSSAGPSISTRSRGGSMSLISMRVTLMPQG